MAMYAIAVVLVLGSGWLFVLPPDAYSRQQKALCDRISLCKKYAQSRRRCVGSADFQGCIDKELKGIDLTYVNLCTDDGELRNKPDGAPSIIECIFRRLR
jgi:hypothetical protein